MMKFISHYGIIPLNSKFDFNALGEAEKNIYVLIAKRFAMQFYPPREYIAYNIELEYSGAIFTANAQKTLKSGFKGVFNEATESSSDESNVGQDEEEGGQISRFYHSTICKACKKRDKDE